MKKIITILLLTLISFTTITSSADAFGMELELISDAEETNKELKKDKKEFQEFTFQGSNKYHSDGCANCLHLTHSPFLGSHPIIDKQTPPPDFTC
jgi:hypothetical protein